MNKQVLDSITSVVVNQGFKTKEEVNGFLLEFYPFEFSHMSSHDKSIIYKTCNIE